MQSVQAAIEALSDKNATVTLQFDHVKIEWPIPFTNQTSSMEITGQIVVSVTTEDMKGRQKSGSVVEA